MASIRSHILEKEKFTGINMFFKNRCTIHTLIIRESSNQDQFCNQTISFSGGKVDHENEVVNLDLMNLKNQNKEYKCKLSHKSKLTLMLEEPGRSNSLL